MCVEDPFSQIRSQMCNPSCVSTVTAQSDNCIVSNFDSKRQHVQCMHILILCIVGLYINLSHVNILIMFHAYIKVLYEEGAKVRMIGRNLSSASEYNLMS